MDVASTCENRSKKSSMIFVGDADSRVADFERRTRCVGRRWNATFRTTSPSAEPDRVVHQVRDDLTQLQLIAAEDRRQLIVVYASETSTPFPNPAIFMTSTTRCSVLKRSKSTAGGGQASRGQVRHVEDVVHDRQELFGARASLVCEICCSALSGVASRRSIMPTIPFIGVRISWLTLVRNCVEPRRLQCRIPRAAEPPLRTGPVR